MTNKKATFGASIAALLGITCPLCWGAAAAFLSSIGLGFVVSLKFFVPLIILFLLIAWWGMYEGYKNNHHQIAPLVVSIIAGLLILFGRYIIGNLTLSNVAIGLFIGTALWNWNLIKTCKR